MFATTSNSLVTLLRSDRLHSLRGSPSPLSFFIPLRLLLYYYKVQGAQNLLEIFSIMYVAKIAIYIKAYGSHCLPNEAWPSGSAYFYNSGDFSLPALRFPLVAHDEDGIGGKYQM